jgi:hypothetical protein
MRSPGIENQIKKVLLTAVIPIGKMNGDLSVLESWLPQISTYPLRLIIVHDVQDVHTTFALNKMMSEFHALEITMISGIFGSPGLARNKGTSLVNSKWIAYWDCDDFPSLERIFEAIQSSENSCEILVGGFTLKVSDSSILSERHASNPSVQSVAINPGVWRMVFKTSLIPQLIFSDLKLAEDQLLLSQICFAERNACFIPFSFYVYHLGGPNQLTNSKSGLYDLLVASKILLIKTNKYLSNETILFNLTLVIRQQMTLLKRGGLGLRLSSIKLLFQYIVKLKPSTLKIGFVAIKNVVSASRKSRLL